MMGMVFIEPMAGWIERSGTSKSTGGHKAFERR
jgi:hypothetical protein